jgi:hypothetical protein
MYCSNVDLLGLDGVRWSRGGGYMDIAVALIGLFIVSIGLLGIASPARLVSEVKRFQSPRGLYGVAAIRVVIGSVLLIEAPDSRAPGLLFGFGVLALVAGLITPFFGVQRFEAILAWWARQPSVIVRVWCVLVAAIGLGMVWSVLA